MTSFALSELASRPASEYLDIIRDEVHSVLAMEENKLEDSVDENKERTKGWSKQAIAKMYKLDSFTKEILRVYDIQPRKFTKGFTKLRITNFHPNSPHGKPCPQGLCFLGWDIYPCRINSFCQLSRIPP